MSQRKGDFDVEDVLPLIDGGLAKAEDRELVGNWILKLYADSQRFERDYKRLRLDFATIVEVTKQINTKSLDIQSTVNFTLNMVMGQFAVLKGLMMHRDSYSPERVMMAAGKNVKLPELDFLTSGTFAQKLCALGRSVFIMGEDKDLGIFPEVKVLKECGMHVLVPLLKITTDEGVELMGVIGLGAKYGERSYSNNEFDLLGLLGSMIAIALSNAQLYQKSVTDALTRVYSRGYFDLQLSQEIERSRRYKDPKNIKPCTLFMIDIDHFKRFNDTYGHQVGDQVLRDISSIFDENMRKSDTVARYGGEEFSIILPETPKKIALVVGERLRRKVEAHRLLLEDGREISVTISMGVATYPYDAGSALELVRHADQALYQAKDRGRNQVVACEASA